MDVESIEFLREELHRSLNALIGKIGRIQIGTPEQFPYGWRRAGKGRTVWRIIEEVITQNLIKSYKELGITEIVSSVSETSIFDFAVSFEGEDKKAFVNIKSAVDGGKLQKDDLSKGEGIKLFYETDINQGFFVATFFIKFNEDMSISIDRCAVFPIAWIPDIYINPSNNGNLQSSKYKYIENAVKRTSAEFFELFKVAMEEAKVKKNKKSNPGL